MVCRMISLYHRKELGAPLNKDKTLEKDVWVVAQEPTDTEMATLGERFGIDIDLLRDAVDPFEAPRLEIDDGVVHIYARFPFGVQHGPVLELTTAPVLVVLTDRAVLTVSRQRMNFLDTLIESTQTLTTQRVRLVLQILEAIMRTYYREVISVRKDVRRFWVNPHDVSERDIFKFVELENRLTDYTSALAPVQEMFSQMQKNRAFSVHEDDADFLEDMRLSAEQLVAMSVSTLRTITNLREAYGVVSASKLNKVIRMLTVLTVILTIPTMVTSFFGMNVPLPFATSAWTPLFIALGSLSVSGGLLWLFYTRRWL